MPSIFRNYIVFANNKRQNIESRLFATGSGFRTGSVAVSYNSFFNKFISDLPTISNRVSPKYFAAESTGSGNSLIYQNNRAIYLQNYDIFVQETVSSTRQNDTSSANVSLGTKYYLAESTGSGNSLIYQNNRAIYLQNYDIFVQESISNTRQNDTGSTNVSLGTKYYLAESTGNGNSIIYQNNRSIYLQNYDIFVQETVSNTRQNDTGSANVSLGTKYYLAESTGSGNSLIYQNNRSIYLQNYDVFVQETVSNTRQNDTGSANVSLGTKYYLADLNASGDSLTYQNNKSIYLQNYDIFVTEAGAPITRQNETGSTNILLNTNYLLADVTSTSAAQLGYQNNRSIYLENNDVLIKETVSNTRQSETGSANILLGTNYLLADVTSTSANQLGYQNNRSIYLENNDILIKETINNTRQNETGSNSTSLTTKYLLADATSTSAAQLGYQNNRSIYLENSDILIKETVSNTRQSETGSFSLNLFTNYYNSQSNATGSTLSYQNFKYIYLEDDSYLLTE
jgi:hypothetical protein